MDILANLLGQTRLSEPRILAKNDLPSVAKYLKSNSCENVFMMVGAGISTSAGIPDFRSPDTGLYANLARLNLPYPEAVFDIHYFGVNPQPFYTLAAELYPGYYRPTITHSFIRLLAEKGKLRTVFSQNIDTLERVAGVPENKIFEAHGSFASQRCIECRKPFPDDLMKDLVMKAEVPFCQHKGCGGIVKPDIVFFGEGLPDGFGQKVEELGDADLLLILGTSLTVYPFASLRSMVDASCPRVLINLDKVSDIGTRSDDVYLQMSCDEAVRKICKEIGDGWEEELDRLWKDTEKSYTPRELKAAKPDPSLKPVAGKLPRNPGLEAEVARIAKVVEEKMVAQESPSKTEDPKPSTTIKSSKQSEVTKDVKEEENAADVSLASIRPAASSSAGDESEATSQDEQRKDLLGDHIHAAKPETVHYDDGQLSIPQTTNPDSKKTTQ